MWKIAGAAVGTYIHTYIHIQRSCSKTWEGDVTSWAFQKHLPSTNSWDTAKHPESWYSNIRADFANSRMICFFCHGVVLARTFCIALEPSRGGQSHVPCGSYETNVVALGSTIANNWGGSSMSAGAFAIFIQVCCNLLCLSGRLSGRRSKLVFCSSQLLRTSV